MIRQEADAQRFSKGAFKFLRAMGVSVLHNDEGIQTYLKARAAGVPILDLYGEINEDDREMARTQAVRARALQG